MTTRYAVKVSMRTDFYDRMGERLCYTKSVDNITIDEVAGTLKEILNSIMHRIKVSGHGYQHGANSPDILATKKNNFFEMCRAAHTYIDNGVKDHFAEYPDIPIYYSDEDFYSDGSLPDKYVVVQAMDDA